MGQATRTTTAKQILTSFHLHKATIELNTKQKNKLEYFNTYATNRFIVLYVVRLSLDPTIQCKKVQTFACKPKQLSKSI